MLEFLEFLVFQYRVLVNKDKDESIEIMDYQGYGWHTTELKHGSFPSCNYFLHTSVFQPANLPPADLIYLGCFGKDLKVDILYFHKLVTSH